MTTTLGVLVAGGRGTRMGDTVLKADIMVAGRTLCERAVTTLAAACGVVVAAAPRERVPRSLPAAAAWVEDAEGGEGPLAGVVAGLRARPFDRAIVLGVDFPLVTSAVLRVLLDLLERSPAAAVVPAPGGVMQPLVAAYAPPALDALADAFARGERSITVAVCRLTPRILTDDDLAGLHLAADIWLNVNTPDDVALAIARLVARESQRPSRAHS